MTDFRIFIKLACDRNAILRRAIVRRGGASAEARAGPHRFGGGSVADQVRQLILVILGSHGSRSLESFSCNTHHCIIPRRRVYACQGCSCETGNTHVFCKGGRQIAILSLNVAADCEGSIRDQPGLSLARTPSSSSDSSWPRE
jgi:hypothetical protein